MPLNVCTNGMLHTHTHTQISNGWEKELSRNKALSYGQWKVLDQGQSITLVICTVSPGRQKEHARLKGGIPWGGNRGKEWGGLAPGSLPSASLSSSSLFICFLQCPYSQGIFWTKGSLLKRNLETKGTIQFFHFTLEATEAQRRESPKRHSANCSRIRA